MPIEPRFLLCRPEGGLNDILCQIYRCHRYARRYRRTLLIDTAYAGGFSFHESLANYFESRRSDVRLEMPPADHLDHLRVFPTELAGRIHRYQAKWSDALGQFVDEQSGVVLSFDFHRDHDAPLLLHHGAGGGEKSVRLLGWLKLKPALLAELASRIASMGAPYTALHVRNTDSRTEYRESVTQLAPQIRGPVFIATDSREVRDFCREVFGAERVFSFSQLPADAGHTLHYHRAAEDAGRVNREAIVDLLLLSMARRFFYFPIVAKGSKRRYSGYSRLAANLRFMKRYLLTTQGLTATAVLKTPTSMQDRLFSSLWRLLQTG